MKNIVVRTFSVVVIAVVIVSFSNASAMHHEKDIVDTAIAAGSFTTLVAADVVKIDSAESVQGASIGIAVKDGKVILNESAAVIQTDIKTSNGVIHVIDTVILPPED